MSKTFLEKKGLKTNLEIMDILETCDVTFDSISKEDLIINKIVQKQSTSVDKESAE
jgi:hypothetical protein